MKKNRMSSGYFDRSGKFHEVKFVRDAAAFSDEAQSVGPLPDLQEPCEFSCKVECSEDFVKELKEELKKQDEKILEGYDVVSSAVQYCLDEVHPQCHNCVYKGADNCRYLLMDVLLNIIRTQRDLAKQAIEEKWRECGDSERSGRYAG